MSTSLLDNGPGLFLAQPFSPNRRGWDSLEACCRTAGAAGYRGGIQLPLWDSRLIDLDLAATSSDYCQEVLGKAAAAGCPITTVANHLNTNLVVISPAYAAQLSLFAPEPLHFASIERLQEWADDRVRKTILATKNLGLNRVAAFSGGTLFPYVYKWPAQPSGLLDNAFRHLAKRWKPHFDLAADNGVKFAFELHPGMDLLCGGAFRQFLENYADAHEACHINLDVSHLRLMGMNADDIEVHMRDLAERIAMWHIKDAELNSNGEWSVYCFLPWVQCPGRFRSLGDGQIDYPRYFRVARRLGIDAVPVVEWECCMKGIEQGIVEEGAPYVEACIASNVLPVPGVPRPHNDVFDAFAGGESGRKLIAAMLGIAEGDVVLPA